MESLIVTNPFGGHEIGDRITDPAEIQAVLSGEHAHSVVQADHEIVPADAPEAPAPEPTTTQES